MQGENRVKDAKTEPAAHFPGSWGKKQLYKLKLLRKSIFVQTRFLHPHNVRLKICHLFELCDLSGGR